MKILYVEDDLSGTIDRLIRLFEKYLNKQAIDNLRILNNDEYGGTTDKIKEVVESTNIIEVADSFPVALQEIVNDYERYACFIVDRNLIDKKPYSFQEINQIDHNYNNALYEKYREREGDYLLVWLGTKSPSVLQKFNFLSAYPKDDIRGIETIQTFIDMKKFKEEQFFDKDDEGIVKLKKKIDKIEVLNTQYENRTFLDILRTYLDENNAELFLNVLSGKDEKNRIGANLKDIRKIYEAVLDRFAENHPEMRSVELDKSGKKIKLFNEFNKLKKDATTIDWLNKNEHINDILRNFFFSFKGICGTDGHPASYQPTINTVNALVYALKDTILWFGDKCRKHS